MLVYYFLAVYISDIVEVADIATLIVEMRLLMPPIPGGNIERYINKGTFTLFTIKQILSQSEARWI